MKWSKHWLEAYNWGEFCLTATGWWVGLCDDMWYVLYNLLRLRTALVICTVLIVIVKQLLSFLSLLRLSVCYKLWLYLPGLLKVVRMYLFLLWQHLTLSLHVSFCFASLLKGAARNRSIVSFQLTHSEELRPQVEDMLTYLLTDLTVDEMRRIERGQCTLDSGLVCPCIEVLPISEWEM